MADRAGLNVSGARSNRSTSFSRAHGGRNLLGESEVSRLQREVDNYTRKVEQEKRRLIATEETHSMVMRELTELKRRVNETQSPLKEDQKVKGTQIKNLENQLENTITKYNDIVAKNNKLRDEIDILRRERTAFLQVYKNMQIELDETKKGTVNLQGEVQENLQKIDTTNSKIQTLSVKNEREKTKYAQQYELIEREMKDLISRRDNGLKSMQKTKEKFENFDTHTLLKRRLQKIIFNNREKVKIIDQYIKNMKIIDEAFTQIKDNTGITDVEEIMTIFIKAEEQNISLMNYASMLSQDIDTMEEHDRDLKREIEELEILKRRKLQEAEGNEQEKEKKRIISMIEQRKKESETIKSTIEELQIHLEPLLQKLSESRLNNHVMGRYNYDGSVNVNENNIEQYLAELEDYLNVFLIYIVKSKEAENTAESIYNKALMLDDGEEQDHGNKSHTTDIKEPNLKELAGVVDNQGIEQFLKMDEMSVIAAETLEKRKAAGPGFILSPNQQQTKVGKKQASKD
eukprot:TRINITY_DN8001_c0_g1_i3.p1 TRINITY_DN8001_c0_g1~~TRINITY_DN8001_c0_g1_i3.p1  ORF type:complete len:516 (+),score=147.52 TRINITY_DN8001_c0_g1_i3:130-1677(+)